MRFLAGDIGGTKTLLALFQVTEDGFVFERKEKFISHEFKDLISIINLFLKGDRDVKSTCFGIAGPIRNGECKTTNLPWVVSSQKIKEAFGFDDVFLLNDLEANAYGLKTLKAKDLYLLNEGNPNLEGNQALISAGTGLGEAPIFFANGEHIPSTSEGGHADFSPRNDLEVELFKYLRNKFDHVSYERVLSGQGLVNLYRFLIDTKVESEIDEVIKKMKEEDPAKVISIYGLSGKCKACERALDLFCCLYGAEAGNFALKVMAINGVYVGGGIAPKIIEALKRGSFMRSFTDKGRMSSLLNDIPIYVVMEENTALLGSAYYCQKQVLKKII